MEEAKYLMAVIDEIDRRVKENSERLKEENCEDMRKELKDDDDFPRNDIDVHTVVEKRQKINRLLNDRKKLMEVMEKTLHHLHENAKEKKEETETEKILMDLAIITDVDENSELFKKGIRCSDVLLKYGDIKRPRRELIDFEKELLMEKLSLFTQQHLLEPIHVTIKRHDQVVQLNNIIGKETPSCSFKIC
ncbi:hypothetical protein SNEBB_007887 [Seison nebaliae]|nr:hypothetical protein SNEBB_007887 [Seison nebaliae]